MGAKMVKIATKDNRHEANQFKTSPGTESVSFAECRAVAGLYQGSVPISTSSGVRITILPFIGSVDI